MKTMYSPCPDFAPNAKLPVADVHYPPVVRDGDAKPSLNDEQLDTIAQLEGHVVINSGAGSGKTTVLVARLLAIRSQFPDANVLMITFSRKAAFELRDRIGSSVKCHVSTFHSLAYQLLMANGYKGFSLNTNEGARDAAILKIIGKRTDTTLEKVVRSMNRISDVDKPTENVREKFFALLLKNKAITFDSMQPFALRLLQHHANVLHALQDAWDFVMVDEAQDMDEVQIEIVRLLTQKCGNVCLCGDTRQAIYSFRGALPYTMDNFAHESGAVTKNMNVNYRSNKQILGLANRIMVDMPSLVAAYQTTTNDKPLYLTAEDERDEAAHVVSEIANLHKSGLRYDKMAVLYRSSFAASAFIEAMLSKEIPFVCKSHASIKAMSDPYRNVVDVMRYSLDLGNAKLFKPLLRSLYIRQSLMSDIQKNAKKNDCSLIHAAAMLPLPFFQSEYIGQMESVIGSLAHMSPADALEALLASGFAKAIGNEKVEILEAWKSELAEFPSILAFLTHLDDMSDKLAAIRTKGVKAKGDAVQVMTIHASKGLEFPAVFVIGCADGILPSSKEGADIDEERRLLYVAVTRAKQKLYISYPASSTGSSNENKASRFLLDAFSDARNA